MSEVMQFEDAGALRRSLERRLAAAAGGDPVRLLHARTHVVVDRLLARLTAVAPDSWALAGDYAFHLRVGRWPSLIRRSRIDWRVDRMSEFDSVPLEAALHDAGDFFEFEVETTGGRISGRSAGRFLSFRASLAGEEFETVRTDFEFRYGWAPTAPLGIGEPLRFAGVEPVEIDAVRLEVQVAEMLRDYSGACFRGFDPGRPESLLNLGLVAERTSLDATLLRSDIEQLFARDGAEPPTSLPDPFEHWPETFRHMVDPTRMPPELQVAAALLNPILSGEVVDGVWNATRREWIAWEAR
jgi:hypothetical protein